MELDFACINFLALNGALENKQETEERADIGMVREGTEENSYVFLTYIWLYDLEKKSKFKHQF